MILSLGEILFDVYPDGFKAIGGAPLNASVAAAKMGSSLLFIGSVGEDALGEELLKASLSLPISSDLHVKRHSKSTYSEVSLSNGERNFIFHHEGEADIDFSLSHFSSLLRVYKPSLVHFGSLMLRNEEGRSFLSDAKAKIREHPQLLSSFDVNLRLSLFSSLEEAKKIYFKVIGGFDIVKISMDELLLLSGQSTFSESLSHFPVSPKALLLISDGRQGSYLRYDSRLIFAPSFPLTPADTTGAGDAYMGAFLSSIDHALSLGNKAPNSWDLEGFLAFSNAVGALTTQRQGAIDALPSKNEALSFLAKHRLG